LDADKEAPAEATKVQKTRQEALTDTERQILLSLNERKRQLDQRDLLLNQREEQLRALRDNIQRQVKELKRLQAKIEASMDAKKSQDAENLNKVVGLYNGMDPKKSAGKFATLDSKVAVQILLGMNQRKAAAVLEELPPDVAKRITEQIVSKVPQKN
jgi:flagellar motility protein MotE (MotC chaperone)